MAHKSDMVTHKVQLWLANDQGWYSFIQNQIEASVDGYVEDALEIDALDEDSLTRDVLNDVASAIECSLDSIFEDQGDDINPIFREFICDALNAVDWDELAAYYEDEIREAIREALARA